MRLEPTNDDLEWDDEEASYYDDNVIYVEDDDSLCDTVCIENIRSNPLEFSIVDDRMCYGGKYLGFNPSKYSRQYQTMKKEIKGVLPF